MRCESGPRLGAAHRDAVALRPGLRGGGEQGRGGFRGSDASRDFGLETKFRAPPPRAPEPHARSAPPSPRWPWGRPVC